MSIKFAILGMLSWKPATGYELKKVFEESSSMYWSGNNNQIYKTLVQIQEEGSVTNEVIHQDGTPSKKVYTITESGLNELKKWVMSTPEAPEFKKQFLIQLAWADQLSNQELHELLLKYENDIKVQLLIQEEKTRRALYSPNRNPRESFLWDMISKNIVSSYKNELDWVQEVRESLQKNFSIEEKNKMNYQINQINNKKYIVIISTPTPLSTDNDTNDLIALTWEADSNLLLLPYSTLSEDFFDLKTGVAGKMLQKFINYHVKVAAVIPNEIMQRGRFREMALETNKRSNHFRMYANKEEAEKWLLS